MGGLNCWPDRGNPSKLNFHLLFLEIRESDKFVLYQIAVKVSQFKPCSDPKVAHHLNVALIENEGLQIIQGQQSKSWV